MKTLLATAAVLIAVGIMGTSDSANAASLQPIASVYQNDHVQPVRWHRGWGWHRNWRGYGGYYVPWHHHRHYYRGWW